MTKHSLTFLFACMWPMTVHGQLPCDPDLDPTPVSGAIFGRSVEPWQKCGDTLVLEDLVIVYSFPECRIWASKQDAKKKWSTDLSSHGECKIMAMHHVNGKEVGRSFRKFSALIQLKDKRTYLLKRRTGAMHMVAPGQLEAMNKKAARAK